MERRSTNTPKATSAQLRLETLEPRYLLAADFLSFNVVDASGDDSALSTFESSAVLVSYDFDTDDQPLVNIDLFVNEGDQRRKVGENTSENALNQLISLDGFSDFAGTREFFAVASLPGDVQVTSPIISIDVLPTTSFFGNFTGETFNYNSSPGEASIYYGGGGTDSLSLGLNSSMVASLNGQPLASYQPNSMVSSQVIYAGTAFDYLRLTDDREIYFQGIEKLKFSDGSETELQTRTNDTRYNQQWQLAIGDVTDAWRFTRGSDDVLLVSIDTGIPISGGNATFSDLSEDRLSFAGSASGSEHGHQAVSVMASTPNNGTGVAGLNWESEVLVLDVYGGEDDAGNIGINTAINTAMSHLDSIPATRVVFQGGIQGEYWLGVLNNSLIPSILDEALFAVAAGNGGQDISVTSHPDEMISQRLAGIARLEGVHENVMAIGALQPGSGQVSIDGQTNVTNPQLAFYSNFGENLTFAVPTDVYAQLSGGGTGVFTGTSAANPVMAGYASLVWSMNPQLTAPEVRQLLADTVTDLGDEGRDPTFGHGVPNISAAVRQLWASNENSALANIDTNPFVDLPLIDPPIPFGPGDFNSDFQIDGQDLIKWQGTYALNAGSDADNDGDSDGFDFLTWQRNNGAGIPTVTALLDPSTLNSSFEDHAGSTGLAVDANVQRALSTGTTPATIAHWTLNASAGIGGWEASTSNVSSDGTAYAFANDTADVTLTSTSPTSYATIEGDVFTLTFDTGSNNGAPHVYEARLKFGANTYVLDSIIDTNKVSGDPGESLLTRVFEYTATATDIGLSPTVEIFMDNQGGVSKSYLDNVTLAATRRVPLPATTSAALASVPTAISQEESPANAASQLASLPPLSLSSPQPHIAEQQPAARTLAVESLYAVEAQAPHVTLESLQLLAENRVDAENLSESKTEGNQPDNDEDQDPFDHLFASTALA